MLNEFLLILKINNPLELSQDLLQFFFLQECIFWKWIIKNLIDWPLHKIRIMAWIELVVHVSSNVFNHWMIFNWQRRSWNTFSSQNTPTYPYTNLVLFLKWPYNGNCPYISLHSLREWKCLAIAWLWDKGSNVVHDLKVSSTNDQNPMSQFGLGIN